MPRLRDALTTRGYANVRTVLRSGDEIAAVLARDPLGHQVTDPSRYSVTFLPEQPHPDRVAALPPADDGEYALDGRELYLWLPDGMARTGWPPGPGTGSSASPA